MEGEWADVATFADLIEEGALEIGDGYRARNEELGGNGPIFLRAGHVTNSHIDFSGVERFHRALEPRVRSKLAKSGDAVVTTKGNSTGRTTFVTPSMPPFVYSPHLSYWRSRNRGRIEAGFLRYWSKGPEFSEQLAGMKASTDMAPYLSLNDQKRLRISIPAIEDQRAIAHVLGTLDDKIDLNRRTSETLEAMARALFKSWFVDFDPVRAKAEGRDPGLPESIADLFPDSFEGSEMGEIPTGWTVRVFGTIVEELRIRSSPLDAPDTYFQHFSIPAYDDGMWPRTELGDAIKSQKACVSPGVILLSKLNPEIPRVWLVDIDSEDLAVGSTEWMVLRPVDHVGRAFVYCLCKSSRLRREIEGLITGTSKSHQRARPQAILRLNVVLPDKSSLLMFEEMAGSMFGQAQFRRRESRTLTALRDTLLPRLISGQLRIADAERIVGEAV